MRHLLFSALFMLTTLAAAAEKKNSVEAGLVQWRRDYDAALAEAKLAEKPVATLFQEIPG